MGLALYKYDCAGFLQWGYNFYNSRESLRHIDPYLVTDADGGFPAGDSFSVYPGEDGCLESLRLVAFTKGLHDLRALRLLETRMGHEATVALVEDALGYEIAFDKTPYKIDEMARVRDAVNQKLAELFR